MGIKGFLLFLVEAFHRGFGAGFLRHHFLQGFEGAQAFFVAPVEFLKDQQGVVVVTQVVVFIGIVRLLHQVGGTLHVFISFVLISLVIEHLAHIEQGDGLHGFVAALLRFIEQDVHILGFACLVVQAIVAGDQAVHLLHKAMVVQPHGVVVEGTVIEFQCPVVRAGVEVEVAFHHVQPEVGQFLPYTQLMHDLLGFSEVGEGVFVYIVIGQQAVGQCGGGKGFHPGKEGHCQHTCKQDEAARLVHIFIFIYSHYGLGGCKNSIK